MFYSQNASPLVETDLTLCLPCIKIPGCYNCNTLLAQTKTLYLISVSNDSLQVRCICCLARLNPFIT